MVEIVGFVKGGIVLLGGFTLSIVELQAKSPEKGRHGKIACSVAVVAGGIGDDRSAVLEEGLVAAPEVAVEEGWADVIRQQAWNPVEQGVGSGATNAFLFKQGEQMANALVSEELRPGLSPRVRLLASFSKMGAASIALVLMK